MNLKTTRVYIKMLLLLELALSWRSFKALRKQGDTNTGCRGNEEGVCTESQQIMQLWCCLALFKVYESYLEWVLKLVPFYQSSKTVFVFWLTASQSRGLVMGLYESLIIPVFRVVESKMKMLNCKVVGYTLECLLQIQEESWMEYISNTSNTELHEWNSYLTLLFNNNLF